MLSAVSTRYFSVTRRQLGPRSLPARIPSLDLRTSALFYIKCPLLRARPAPSLPLAVEATDVDHVHDDPGGGFDARDARYDVEIGVSTRAAVRRRARAVVRPRRAGVEEERISQCRRGRWRGGRGGPFSLHRPARGRRGRRACAVRLPRRAVLPGQGGRPPRAEDDTDCRRRCRLKCRRRR